MLYSAQETLQFFKNLLHIIAKQNDQQVHLHIQFKFSF
jgi:hypothetical protein